MPKKLSLRCPLYSCTHQAERLSKDTILVEMKRPRTSAISSQSYRSFEAGIKPSRREYQLMALYRVGLGQRKKHRLFLFTAGRCDGTVAWNWDEQASGTHHPCSQTSFRHVTDVLRLASLKSLHGSVEERRMQRSNQVSMAEEIANEHASRADETNRKGTDQTSPRSDDIDQWLPTRFPTRYLYTVCKTI